MATAASLSAFSFWQATRFAGEDAEVRERARLATIDAAQDERELQALVDFDLDLYTGYCAASVERDGALETMFESGLSGASPAQQALVTQRLRADSVWGLLQADAPGSACATGDPATDPYSVERARELRTAQDPTFGAAGLPPASAGGGAARAERQLMYAAVAFAAALFLLTAAGLAERDPVPPGGRDGRRKAWVRVWQVLAGAALATGSVLVVIHVPFPTIAGWLAATGAALALAYWIALRVPQHRKPHADAKGVRWWAELVGGIALVALALAALELSAVAGRERSARALADRQSVAAERLLEAGEQAALHDLATSSELAELDARAAAANQDPGATTEADRIEHARLVTEAHADTVADRLEEAPDGDAGLVPDETCPEEARPVRPSYDRLLAAAWTDPETFGGHIAASREEGEVCAVLAGLLRGEADVWAARAKVLTVSLVALGLGGFLLALAADPQRTMAPARWLLSLGVVGVGAGAAVALSVLVYGLVDIGLDRSSRVGFAEDVAAAETALARGSCGAALRQLDQALATHDGYAPAYAARAESRLCDKDDTWLISPPLRDGQVEAALEDDVRAAELREPGATELADSAWLRLLLALEDPRPEQATLHESADLAREAARAASDAGSPGVHVARFNHALARLAVGKDAEPGYRYALRCLDPAASCAGGGIEDDGLVAVYRLMALDDLELLAGRVPETKLDRYRALIMSDDAVAVAPGEGPRPTLAVFPQELELDAPDEPDTDVSIVWYHRAGPDQPWDVIYESSLSTAAPGDHDNTPIPTYHPLPAGEYRADVYYTDGRRSSTVTSWDGAPGDQRVVVPDLGVSAVVPLGWSVSARERGVEAAVGYGATPDVLVFRRSEGEGPSADRELEDWLDDTLDEWIATQAGPEATENAVDVTDDGWWYLGLSDIRVREYPDADVWAAIGVVPYAVDPYCGGTVFMTLVRDPDSDVVAAVVDSLVLDQGSTSRLDPFTGQVVRDDWSVELPTDWVGAYLTPVGAADRFAAQECISGAWLSIESEEVPEDEIAGTDPLTDIADTRVAGLIDGTGLTLDRWDDTELASGDPAVDVTLAATIDGFAIEHRELYVLDGTTLYTLTLTVPGDGDYGDVVDQVFDSFALM